MSDHDSKKPDDQTPERDATKTQKLTGQSEGGTDMQEGDAGGEDEGSAPIDGDDSHLKEDQKPKY